MSRASREQRISAAFVAVADTLTTDFDVLDLLHTLVEQCTQILDTDAGGLMLMDGNGQLQLMTSTSEAADFVEVMQLNASAGPCIECFTSGTAQSVPSIKHLGQRWPDFQKAAILGGFKSAHATPMKLRGQVIGTMNLFSTKRGALSERDAAVAQALTDVATIGILQERVVQEVNTMAEQLHKALDSRVLVEQAKGVIAHSLSIDMDAAFSAIRAYAHANSLTIRAVAEGISNRSITLSNAVSRVAAHRRSS
jgi:GAF domain-containing protein